MAYLPAVLPMSQRSAPRMMKKPNRTERHQNRYAPCRKFIKDQSLYKLVLTYDKSIACSTISRYGVVTGFTFTEVFLKTHQARATLEF